MHLRSDSFKPYDVLDPRLAFGRHHPETHFTFAGNRNPHLAWEGVPDAARSLVVLCVDEDAPSRPDDVNQEGRTVPVDLPRAPFFHWVLVDLPPELRAIAEGAHCDEVTPQGKGPGASPDGGRHGLNSYTGWFQGNADMEGRYFGYDGPAPPWNDERVHGYRFRVFALDVPSLDLPDPFTGEDVQRAMEGHILDQAELIGLYAIYPHALSR
jgi:Raf kinase inhibitor-like YbhB/YbcL family protein